MLGAAQTFESGRLRNRGEQFRQCDSLRDQRANTALAAQLATAQAMLADHCVASGDPPRFRNWVATMQSVEVIQPGGLTPQKWHCLQGLPAETTGSSGATLIIKHMRHAPVLLGRRIAAAPFQTDVAPAKTDKRTGELRQCPAAEGDRRASGLEFQATPAAGR